MEKPKKLLIFDLKGPMAHFRKFYTNSSSLSYLFPPRTVIAGIIASILGLPSERYYTEKNKDKIYYEILQSKECLIGLSMKSSLRKIMQTVNYCFTKTQNNEIRFGQPTQIPLEILLSKKINNEVKYRVYFTHYGDNELYNDFKEFISNNEFKYPPYLGLSEFPATTEFIAEADIKELNSEHDIKLSSVCKLNDVDLDFDKNGIQYLIEKMPTGFSNNRNPLDTEDYVVEVNKGIIYARPKHGYYSIEYLYNDKQITENVLFI